MVLFSEKNVIRLFLFTGIRNIKAGILAKIVFLDIKMKIFYYEFICFPQIKTIQICTYCEYSWWDNFYPRHYFQGFFITRYFIFNTKVFMNGSISSSKTKVIIHIKPHLRFTYKTFTSDHGGRGGYLGTGVALWFSTSAQIVRYCTLWYIVKPILFTTFGCEIHLMSPPPKWLLKQSQ